MDFSDKLISLLQSQDRQGLGFDGFRLIVFDLDDTLFPEANFLHSGYREIARRASARFGIAEEEVLRALFCPPDGLRPFDALSLKVAMTVEEMVQIYRTHRPDIALAPEVKATLTELHGREDTIVLILTQGRVTTQTNKIEALGLDSLTDGYVIVDNPVPGEDPDGAKSEAFREIDRIFRGAAKVAVGDNPPKDFLMPNRMGWLTIGLADTSGRNIHPVDLRQFAPPAGPRHIIRSIAELQNFFH